MEDYKNEQTPRCGQTLDLFGQPPAAAAAPEGLRNEAQTPQSESPNTSPPSPEPPAEQPLLSLDLFGEVVRSPSRGRLADLYAVPPFSVLNAREGWWTDRKRKWKSWGVHEAAGRDEMDGYAFQKQGERAASGDVVAARIEQCGDGASMFDPVVAEVMYSWFCPRGGTILDPFAGGSVRGMVAHGTARKYIGVDIREEQVSENIEQAGRIIPGYSQRLSVLNPNWTDPEWLAGDSKVMCRRVPRADFVFSCPPYGDLEVYSDLPGDISNMTHEGFVESYRDCIASACWNLRENSFAAFVIGDYRDKAGNYRGFVSETERAFRAAGMSYYNEIVLLTPVGSLPVRTRKTFDATRKVGKAHQNILVFVKGDPRIATRRILQAEENAPDGHSTTY